MTHVYVMQQSHDFSSRVIIDARLINIITNKCTTQKLHYQMERLNSEVHVKRQEVKELQQQLQILHKVCNVICYHDDDN